MKKPNHIFVTGTDTDVGKTVICSALMSAFSNAKYWKPIQAGLEITDKGTVEQYASGRIIPSHLELELAASPDQGLAQINQNGPSVEELCQAFPKTNDFTIIEGAGGLLVPINRGQETWIDVLRLWRIPILVVARTQLGTLNHSLLTVKHLRDNGLDVLGLVLSGDKHQANEDSLKRLLPDTPLHHFPNQSLPSLNTEDCDELKTFIEENLAATSSTTLKHDQDHVWHPYTQHKIQTDVTEVVGAQGSWVYTSTNEKLIDASASWWVNTVGHGRPEIRAAISRQQARLDHTIFANATHAPGATLAAKLSNLTNQDFSRVFYSDNGSTAVEIGLKMAFQTWTNRGERNRTKFLALKASYHGDTIGTMSVGHCSGFHNQFNPLMFPVEHLAPVTSHPSSVCPDGIGARDQSLEIFSNHLKHHHHEYAGIVLEPMLQGAGGMLRQDDTWLRQIIGMCNDHQIFVILDEVFTGLGRVGANFAYQRAEIDPDIICLAKGLTGGTMPLAVTMANDKIFQEFLSDNHQDALMHGHSYTGNPIGCAAALATLDIYEKENIPAKALQLEHRFQTWWQKESSRLPVVNGRWLGGILAMELDGENVGSNYYDKRALKVPSVARERGLLLRPLGNTIYLVLPLTISESELDFTLTALADVLTEIA